MFSQTIHINHGQDRGCNGMLSQNGHSDSQPRIVTSGSYVGSSCQMGSFHKSNVVQKKYSVEQKRVDVAGVGAEHDVKCFVRSEIKWVFLKNVKVQHN